MAIALVIGATGLVGRALTNLLLENDSFTEVHIFVRRNSGIQHQKLHEHIIDFNKPGQWRHLVKGDVLFSAMGTTQKAAGSNEAQFKVDYTYQYQFAQAAASNGVTHYVLVSAANASMNSLLFYPRMKAQLEQDISVLPFAHIAIMQPGLLAGERSEKRLAEGLALKAARYLQKVPGLKKLKPIPGESVAKAMIVAAKNQTEEKKIYNMQELFAMADSYTG